MVNEILWSEKRTNLHNKWRLIWLQDDKQKTRSIFHRLAIRTPKWKFSMHEYWIQSVHSTSWIWPKEGWGQQNTCSSNHSQYPYQCQVFSWKGKIEYKPSGFVISFFWEWEVEKSNFRGGSRNLITMSFIYFHFFFFFLRKDFSDWN